MRLDLSGRHDDYLADLQTRLETVSRYARTFLVRWADGLKSVARYEPLIHHEGKFNENLFEQKIAHSIGKGLLILPSRERCLAHEYELIRTANFAGFVWVPSHRPLLGSANRPRVADRVADRFPKPCNVFVSRTARVRPIQLPTGEI